jgi:hypothetical protein
VDNFSILKVCYNIQMTSGVYTRKYHNTKTDTQKQRREYYRRLRNSVIETLGGKCIECGFSDKRALQIDHIKGGGSMERKTKKFSGQFHKQVIESFLKGEEKYQLLCANCNWIKRFKNCEYKSLEYND